MCEPAIETQISPILDSSCGQDHPSTFGHLHLGAIGSSWAIQRQPRPLPDGMSLDEAQKILLGGLQTGVLSRLPLGVLAS